MNETLYSIHPLSEIIIAELCPWLLSWNKKVMRKFWNKLYMMKENEHLSQEVTSGSCVSSKSCATSLWSSAANSSSTGLYCTYVGLVVSWSTSFVLLMDGALIEDSCCTKYNRKWVNTTTTSFDYLFNDAVKDTYITGPTWYIWHIILHTLPIIWGSLHCIWFNGL